jgi:hypothetical protein
MSCAICFENFENFENIKNIIGIACNTCNQSCCISCDIKSKQCPFCRTPVEWTSRMQRCTPEQYTHYLAGFIQEDQTQLQRYQSAKQLFSGFVRECPHALDALEQLDDDEDLFNLMVIARDYIYGSAMITKNIDDINFLLEFIEELYDRLEQPDRINLNFDLDDVEELLFNASVPKQYIWREWKITRKIKPKHIRGNKNISGNKKNKNKNILCLHRRPHYRVLC